MNITDLITDRMHENLNPRDIDTVERYRWLIEMIATEYAGIKVKNLTIPRVIDTVCRSCKSDIAEEFIPKCYCPECGVEWQTGL